MAKVRKNQKRLIHIGKATKDLFDSWSEGASLVADFGVSIQDLKHKATADRWKLALDHRREGRRLWHLTSPPYRAIVSRYYYVMYHAMRAVCFFNHGGDDFEAHSKLPQNIPIDFPSRATWQNNLKIARLTRNAADYDPYPKSLAVWKSDAKRIKTDAESLIKVVRTYLISRGCPGI
ncbi:MAG: hypothetical protein R3E01_33055 [Pirellulaceae bacterium]